jgi:hypothetical protein
MAAGQVNALQRVAGWQVQDELGQALNPRRPQLAQHTLLGQDNKAAQRHKQAMISAEGAD